MYYRLSRGLFVPGNVVCGTPNPKAPKVDKNIF